MPAIVSHIFVVDDCCPEGSGALVEREVSDSRVRVIYHEKNLGVGGAVMTGYRAALAADCEIVVKVDGDGQMPPEDIPLIVSPLLAGVADYAKGNRFFNLDSLSDMPTLRLVGNAGLSFISKATSGYWDVMDPTNGFTAIHAEVLRLLPLEKIENRYFFESDMLFRLGTVRAVVRDVPMPALYGDEKSSMRIGKILLEFPQAYFIRCLKRVVYTYFLRDFNAASVQLIAGASLMIVALAYAAYWYATYAVAGLAAPFGMVIVPAMAAILGLQLFIAAVGIDVLSVPRDPIHPMLRFRRLLAVKRPEELVDNGERS